jgi:hypothetical protein
VSFLHQNQEGTVRQRGGKKPASLRVARAVRRGRRRLFGDGRDARDAADLRAELQSVFRDEGAALGKSFSPTKAAPEFPKADGRALQNLWSIQPGDSRKELFCGVEPASLSHSKNGGNSWSKLARGFPKRDAYDTVLRDAMDVDHLPAGTTTGQLWMGRDGGEEWECLFDSRPPIHYVKVAVA